MTIKQTSCKMRPAQDLENLLVHYLLVQAIRLVKTCPDGNAMLACAMRQAGFSETGSISPEPLAGSESSGWIRQDIMVHDTIVELFRQARNQPDGKTTVDHALLQAGISNQYIMEQEMIDATKEAGATGFGPGQENSGDLKNTPVHGMLVNLFRLAMTYPDGPAMISCAMLRAGNPDDFPVLPEWRNPVSEAEPEPEFEFGSCFRVSVMFRKKHNPAQGMMVIERDETTNLNVMFLTFPAGTPILRVGNRKSGDNLKWLQAEGLVEPFGKERFKLLEPVDFANQHIAAMMIIGCNRRLLDLDGKNIDFRRYNLAKQHVFASSGKGVRRSRKIQSLTEKSVNV